MSTESSDFDFSSFQEDSEPIAISVDVLLREYVDGRRRFNNVDLKECDLSYARLPLINLEEALLNKANLTGANLAGATLNHVDFSTANLTNVNLIAADLVRAKLAGAKLTGAVMSGANLSGANLRRADLTGCSFAGANLSGVDFAGATLRNVNLGGANLKGANLSEVDLSDIDLDSLNLEETILAENVAERLWSAQKYSAFGEAADVTQVPDETFYQDFSEPPLPVEDEASFDELAYADTLYVSPTDAETEDELAYADTLYISTTDIDGEGAAASATEGYRPGMPREHDLDGALDDLDFAADGDYPDLEANHLATNASDGTPAGQNWAAAELPFAPAEDGLVNSDEPVPYDDNPFALEDSTAVGDELDTLIHDLTPTDAQAADSGEGTTTGTASNAFDSALVPVAPLAVLPPSPDDLPLVSPGQEPGTPSQASAGQRLGDSPRHQVEADRNRPPSTPALAQTATSAGERSRPGQGTPLRRTAGQSRPTQSINDQMVQSIQSALGRRVQFSLQRKLLEVYQQQCAVTGCTIAPLLETVLIVSNDRSVPDHPSQGLVLRSDLKTLYELKLLAIHPQKLTVLLAPSLLESDYAYLQGQKIRMPQQKIYHPDAATLARHLAFCKWYGPDYDQGRSQDMAVISPGQGSTGSLQRWLTSPPVLALGLSSVALAGLIWAFTSLQRSHLLRPVSPGAPVEQPASVDDNAVADNAINVEASSIVYKHQGVIVDGNAYLALAQAEQLGLPVADIPAADRIEQGGQSYFKVSYLRDRNIPIDWNAATRTLVLDCCTDTTVETIDLTVGDRPLESAGVIVNDAAYVPVEQLDALNVDLGQVAPQNFLEYNGTAYLKASSLKDLAVQLEWNAATRTLVLSN